MRQTFKKRQFRQKRFCVLFLALFFLLAAGMLADYFLRADLRFATQLGAGFNLSNTLECHGLHDKAALPYQYETYWGNPYTTKEMVAAIRAAGFRTLRVPVTWSGHMDSGQQIDPAWMERVRQVVDYGIECGMFVILNAHHDTWYMPNPENAQHAKEMTRSVWAQIAAYFSGYDTHLLFEGMNEPRLIGTAYEWNAGTPQAREVVNQLNGVFVETVRTADGYNKKRYLLLPTYCAETLPDVISDFRMPKGKRLIVSLHLYRPYEFALNESGTAAWNAAADETREIEQAVRGANERFIRRRIPVVITEFGAVDKNNEAARAAWARYVVTAAKTRGIPCIWWDDSVFDRSRLVWNYPEILRTLVSL